MNEREEASYKEFLERKVADLEAQVKNLQQKIEQLKRQKGISSAREGLTFNPKTGTYVEASTGLHHCPKCLGKDKRHPLAEEDWGWRCNVCDAFYSNPDKPPPVISFQPDNDRY